MRLFQNPIRVRVLSGLFTNLAAGWLGSVFIFSSLAELVSRADVIILLANAGFGIVCLQIAFILEEKAHGLN